MNENGTLYQPPIESEDQGAGTRKKEKGGGWLREELNANMRTDNDVCEVSAL